MGGGGKQMGIHELWKWWALINHNTLTSNYRPAKLCGRALGCAVSQAASWRTRRLIDCCLPLDLKERKQDRCIFSCDCCWGLVQGERATQRLGDKVLRRQLAEKIEPPLTNNRSAYHKVYSTKIDVPFLPFWFRHWCITSHILVELRWLYVDYIYSFRIIIHHWCWKPWTHSVACCRITNHLHHNHLIRQLLSSNEVRFLEY